MASNFGSTGKYDMHAISKARQDLRSCRPPDALGLQAAEFETWFERKVGELYGETAQYEIEMDAVEDLLYVEIDQGIKKIEDELKAFTKTLGVSVARTLSIPCTNNSEDPGFVQELRVRLQKFHDDCREALEGSQKFRVAHDDDDTYDTYEFLMATQMKLKVGK